MDHSLPDLTALLNKFFSDRDFLRKANMRLIEASRARYPNTDAAEIVLYERKIGDYLAMLKELHVVQSGRFKGKVAFRLLNVSLSILSEEYPRYEEVVNHILENVSCDCESDIGICFDIMVLEQDGGNYAEKAFRTFISYTDSAKLRGARISRGDILPECRLYCIRVAATSPETCGHVRKVFGADSKAPGLAPLEQRLLSGLALESHPLPFKGVFGEKGYEGTWPLARH